MMPRPGCDELIKAIEKVPEYMVFGNWDYKRCIFCKGPRMAHKKGCIRKKVKELSDEG